MKLNHLLLFMPMFMLASDLRLSNLLTPQDLEQLTRAIAHIQRTVHKTLPNELCNSKADNCSYVLTLWPFSAQAILNGSAQIAIAWLQERVKERAAGKSLNLADL